MQCPKCGKEMEEGRVGAEPPRYWVACDPCGFYTSARTLEELKQRIKPAEVQEITSSDIGKVEDLFK